MLVDGRVSANSLSILLNDVAYKYAVCIDGRPRLRPCIGRQRERQSGNKTECRRFSLCHVISNRSSLKLLFLVNWTQVRTRQPVPIPSRT